ncbi:MAG: hypothetical protein ABIP74_05130 [Candidatus Saccharimonas sp.]
MEFGTAPPPLGSLDIDDATRLAASTRKRTLQPEHDTVVPDDLNDDEIITQHMMQPAVANVTIDTEYTQGDQSDNIAPHKPARIALMAIISGSLLFAALLVSAYLIFAR